MNFFNLSTFDPRAKLMLMICLSTFAMLKPQPLVLTVILGLTVLILLLGGVKTGDMLRQAKGILYMIIALFIVQCVFVRTGEPLIALNGFTLLTAGGLTTAASVCLRFVILVMSALILLTGDSRDYLLALVQMKIPYEIAFMVMAAVHFLPILKEEALDVYYSVQLRGTEIKKAPFSKKIKCYCKICLPILVGAVNRAKRMATAMEARGFRSRPQRTYRRRLRLKVKDTAVIVAAPAAAIALFIML
ncbi:MAG: energy-coupling factor transporter transmembrane component T family protein [Bacillota bacterium]|jgi:energy-coupling factor transport system permease protein